MDVREVDFDDGHGYGRYRIAQRERVVSQRAGIDHDGTEALARGTLDPVDELAFVVRLPAHRLGAATRRVALDQEVELGEGGASVDRGLSRAQEVEVGSVEYENPRRDRPCHGAESIH